MAATFNSSFYHKDLHITSNTCKHQVLLPFQLYSACSFNNPSFLLDLSTQPMLKNELVNGSSQKLEFKCKASGALQELVTMGSGDEFQHKKKFLRKYKRTITDSCEEQMKDGALEISENSVKFGKGKVPDESRKSNANNSFEEAINLKKNKLGSSSEVKNGKKKERRNSNINDFLDSSKEEVGCSKMDLREESMYGISGLHRKLLKKKRKRKPNKDEAASKALQLRVKLEMCSKKGDVMTAIALYDSATTQGLKLNIYHYTVLLYLCSSGAIGVIYPAKSGSKDVKSQIHEVKDEDESDGMLHSTMSSRDCAIESDEELQTNVSEIQLTDDMKQYALTRGLEIYERMVKEQIAMNETTLTSVARMAMSTGNAELAFEIVKKMKQSGITPRLRSYGPALFTFCSNGDIDKAFEVEEHMKSSGVYPEESELAVLLKLSIETRRTDKVYYLLHQLRKNVRQVSGSTAELIEEWFKGPTAFRVGKRKWDAELVKKAMENEGGGSHSFGWLGSGKWNVLHTVVSENGVCEGCGTKLVTVDLNPKETEIFASSVATIALQRELNSSFEDFQRWLDYYGPFEVVIDAANVGLFRHRDFSISRVNAVVNKMRQSLPSKRWPLIVLHNRRLMGGKADKPENRKIIEKWKNVDALYATPTGSNDDWYWLYAAIKFKCLVVTNDEMRDHLFDMLGNDFFSRWKERHQVHFGFNDAGPELYLPLPFSIVIQESEKGYWHVPIASADKSEKNRAWLCITRGKHRLQHKHSTSEGSQTSSTFQDASATTDSSKRKRNLGNLKKLLNYYRRQRKERKSSLIDVLSIDQTVLSQIEEAEEKSGCVIDFQI